MNSYSVQLSLMDGSNKFFTSDDKEDAFTQAKQWIESIELNKQSDCYYDCIKLQRTRMGTALVKSEEIKPDTNFKLQIAREFYYGVQ